MSEPLIRDPMTVWVHNIDQSQPMIYNGVDNTYVKEGFYCMVFRLTNRVIKLPVARIFRIIEPYEVRVSEGRVTGDAGVYRAE
jgi:hypothetical protein